MGVDVITTTTPTVQVMPGALPSPSKRQPLSIILAVPPSLDCPQYTSYAAQVRAPPFRPHLPRKTIGLMSPLSFVLLFVFAALALAFCPLRIVRTKQSLQTLQPLASDSVPKFDGELLGWIVVPLDPGHRGSWQFGGVFTDPIVSQSLPAVWGDETYPDAPPTIWHDATSIVNETATLALQEPPTPTSPATAMFYMARASRCDATVLPRVYDLSVATPARWPPSPTLASTFSLTLPTGIPLSPHLTRTLPALIALVFTLARSIVTARQRHVAALAAHVGRWGLNAAVVFDPVQNALFVGVWDQ